VDIRKCVLMVGVVTLAGNQPSLAFGDLTKPIMLSVQKIEVETGGTYLYWFDNTQFGRRPFLVTAPRQFKGQSVTLDPKEITPGAKRWATPVSLYVLNKHTGNLASVDGVGYMNDEMAKPAGVKLHDSNFVYVPRVTLKIVSESGAPLARGLVRISDGGGTDKFVVLTPADNGDAEFRNVAWGDIEVKVDADGVKKTIDSTFQIPEKRDAPAFEKTVKVSGDVDTLAVAAGEAKPAAGKKPQTEGGSGILQTIVGLILLAIICAIVYVVVKSKGVTAESALRKLGVQIPEDQPGGAAAQTSAEPAVDPNKCPFCGQMKDAAGNCACSLGAGASPLGGGAPTIGPSGPRLIGAQGTYSGSIFQLSGSAIIGRDPSNSIPLPNDTTASRKHASISAANGVYSIRDEGSSNGTFVNGARITEQTLSPGDEVQIGATKFRFEV